jgi:hypothetical protein
MKNQFIISCGAVIVTITILYSSCKKENVRPASGAASLTIVNAVVGSSSLIPNFNSSQPLHYYQSAAEIGFGSSMEFGNYVGNIPLSFVDNSDTTKAVFKEQLSIPAYSIQTLFLTGTLSSVDYFITTDKVPDLAFADSLCAVRFVNLSPGSSPVSVDIQGNANGSEVASLSFKNISDFKKYSAKATISKYVFEFRDVSSGILLASYSLTGVNNGDGNTQTNSVRDHSFTIAFYGALNSQHAFLVHNY